MTVERIQECFFLCRQDDEILMGRKGYWLLAKQDGLHMCLQFLGIDGFEGDQILVKEFEIFKELISEYHYATQKTKTYDRMTFTIYTETGTRFVAHLVGQAAVKI